MIRLIGLNIQESRSSMGTAPDPFKTTESEDGYVIMIPVPGVSRGGLHVYIKNGKRIIVSHDYATVFCPKFKFEFLIPNDTDPDDYNASVENGVLFLHLTKKSS